MLRFDFFRPDDLLNLRVTTENLRVDTCDPNKPALVIDQKGAQAWLAVTLPPQTIAESAFFEFSPITPEQIPGRTNNDAGGTDDDALTNPGQPATGAISVAQLACPSRLVLMCGRTPQSALHRWPYGLDGADPRGSIRSPRFRPGRRKRRPIPPRKSRSRARIRPRSNCRGG